MESGKWNTLLKSGSFSKKTIEQMLISGVDYKL